MIRPRSRALVVPRALALALLVFAALPACAAPPSPIELVESVPVETALGNPELRRAPEVWVGMIDGARRALDLEHFYLSTWPGEPLEPVLAAIGRAAARGVRVRILLDGRMSETYPQPAESLGTVPGIEVRRVFLRRVGGGTQHSKFMVVDGEELYVGSQNLDWRALGHIHEMGVRVRDARLAGEFEQVFEMDWAIAGGAMAADSARIAAENAAGTLDPAWPGAVAVARAAGDTVRAWASFSPPGLLPRPGTWDLAAIVRLFDGARREVAVQLLNYGVGAGARRDTTLDAAIRRAAGRGVRVRLLVSDWQADSDRIQDLQSLAAVKNVQARMSVVPEWSGGYIPFARVEHCKYMVVDGEWTWVGTSNWEPSYFNSARNAALTLRDRRIAAQALRSFETSWSAEGGIAVVPGRTYEPRIHRETPPAGREAYGR